MNRFKAAGILLMLAAPAFAVETRTPHDPVEKVGRIVDFIKGNKGRQPTAKHPAKGKEKDFSVTEADANAYIRFWIEEQAKHGRLKDVVVKSAEVHFKEGHVIEADAVAQIGGASLKKLDSLGDSFVVQMLKNSLTVDNNVHLQCVAGAAKGKGFLVIQELRIKGLTLPVALIQKILEIVGKNQHPPQDFAKPMDLPNGIQKLEVLPGELKLQVEPLSKPA